MEVEVSSPLRAEREDAFAAARDCLIGAIQVAGNLDQVGQDVGNGTG